MHILDKITSLPRITIKELQQQARNSHPSKYCSPNSKENTPHAHGIVVVSPFYDKRKQQQFRCDCEFHRLKKVQLKHSKHINCIEQNSHPTMNILNLSDQIQPSQVTPATLKSPYILNQRSSKSKLLQPITNDKKESLSLPKQQAEKIQTYIRNSDNRPIETSYDNNYSTIMSQAQQVSWKRERVFDTSNLQFITLISRRLQNEKYKKGYLKTLFSFIRMKCNINKFYMWHSKAYLSNSLNILLNHFKMEQLVQPEQLQESQILKIAYYMGCQHKQVVPILRQLVEAVKEMQGFLNQLRQNQGKNEQIQAVRKEMSHYESQNVNSLQKIDTLAQSEIKREQDYTISRRHSKVNLLTEESENEQPKRSTKGSTVSLRRSALKTTLQFGNPSTKNTDYNLQHQHQHQKPRKETSQHQSAARNSQMMSTLVPNSRSTRSTVFAVINECRGESRQSTIIKKGKQAKQRKNKAIKLPVYIDPYQKYSGINYSPFCSRKDFMHLVDELQRLDQNEQERAQKIFHLLNAQQFIDDTDKLDLMVSTFSPLFSQKCKEKLLKHIVLVKDRKYIQKLSKQLDHILGEIKRTDPRNFSNEDLCAYKENPILKNQFTQRIIPIKQSRDQHQPIIKQRAHHLNQKKESKNNRFTQSELNLELQQSQLCSIRAQRVEQMLYQSIYHPSKPKKEAVFVSQNYTNVQQKKILQYMRQRHPNTFDYLNQQISTLCSKLVHNQPAA